MTVRVVLVDDQALFRQGMRALLGSDPMIEIVGEAADGAEALQVVSRLEPDVVLLDLRMPKMDGVECTRRLRKAGSAAQIVALTTFDDDALVFDVLREGAISYLLKEASADDIARAIIAASRGESILASEVAHKVVSEFARLARQAQQAPPADVGLSEREREVLGLLVRGQSNKQIAATLCIAAGTVKNHLTSIFTKLGVSDRTQAALWAREHGFGP